MCHYLISIVVPEVHAELLDELVDMAHGFVATGSSAERQDIGLFRRAARGGDSPDDLLRIVRIDEAGEPTAARGRSLESLLRSTLTFAAGGRVGEVRVYVQAESAVAA